MRTLALAEENSTFEAVEDLIGTNGAFCLVEKKEKKRRGEGESSRGAELGAQSPQQGRAHHQRHSAHEPVTYLIFSLI
jgi:hypothetical protein